MRESYITKQRIFFITASFPFGKGEQFIEAELPILQKYFDVIVVPTIIPNIEEFRVVNCGIDKNLALRIGRLTKYQKIFLTLKHFNEFYSYFIDEIGYSNFKLSKIKSLIYRFAAAKASTDYFEQLKSLLGAENNECRNIFYFYWLEFPILAAKCLRYSGLFIGRAHGYDVYAHRWAGNYVPLQKELINSLDYLYPASNSGTEYLISRYGHSNKITTQTLGVDKVFNKEQYSITDNKINFVSCSFCVPVKRINLIIDLLAELKEMGLDLSWTHIGGGVLLEDLRLNATQKLGGATLFLGALPNLEVQETLSDNSYNIFISTSESEGGNPVSMMEAQAYRLPIIATAVGGVPEIVNNENGWLIDKNFDVQQTAKELYTDLKNYALLKVKSNNAYSSFEAKYNANIVYSSFSNMLMRLKYEHCTIPLKLDKLK